MSRSNSVILIIFLLFLLYFFVSFYYFKKEGMKKNSDVVTNEFSDLKKYSKDLKGAEYKKQPKYKMVNVKAGKFNADEIFEKEKNELIKKYMKQDKRWKNIQI